MSFGHVNLVVRIHDREIDLSNSPVVIQGKERYQTSRALYYLLTVSYTHLTLPTKRIV